MLQDKALRMLLSWVVYNKIMNCIQLPCIKNYREVFYYIYQ
jgi:hypothetical protein